MAWHSLAEYSRLCHGTARSRARSRTARSGTALSSTVYSPARRGPVLHGTVYNPVGCRPVSHGPVHCTAPPEPARSRAPQPPPPHRPLPVPVPGVTGGRPSAGRLGAAPGQAGCGVAKSRRSVSGWPSPPAGSSAAETMRRCGEALPSSAASPAAPPAAAAAMAHMAAGAAGGAAGRARAGARPMPGSGAAPLRSAPRPPPYCSARQPRARLCAPNPFCRESGASLPAARPLAVPAAAFRGRAIVLVNTAGETGGAARLLVAGGRAGRADRQPIGGAARR